MPPTQDDFYRSFLNWSAPIGCPQPDPELFRNLARGNGAHFLRLLVEYVRPLETVSHVHNTLRLHSANAPDEPVLEQNATDKKDSEKLAFLRRSHTATIKEIDYLNQKQSQLERSIRRLSTSAVLLERACLKNSRDQVQPIENLTECFTSISKRKYGFSEKKTIISMGDSGRLETSDPIRSTLQRLYETFSNDHTKTVTIPLPFPPSANLVEIAIKISRDHLALLQQNISLPETAEPAKSNTPVSLCQLMQDSRDAHIDRFFDALEKMNLARDAKNRCEGASAPELLRRQIRLRARLDCLNKHINRCEENLSRAQADYKHLHDSLDAISKLDAARERLHQQLVTIIRANRELRSKLTQKQTQCRSNETLIKSAIKTVTDRRARLKNCFEIETKSILQLSESDQSLISDLDDVLWQNTAGNLGLNACQSCHPLSILFSVRSWFEKFSALQISNTVGSLLLAAAKNVQSGDVEGLKIRCRDLHASSERTMVDFNSTLKLLENLDKESDHYRELLRNWWEQPAQHTVPDEQRLGLNISSWIHRRRKLVAELQRDVGRRTALV